MKLFECLTINSNLKYKLVRALDIIKDSNITLKHIT